MIGKFVKKEKVEKRKIQKPDDCQVRTITSEEKEYMKSSIPNLEEHERNQILTFIKMDNVIYTEKKDGVLLNLNDTSEEFMFKIYKFVKQCVDNQKYRKIY